MKWISLMRSPFFLLKVVIFKENFVNTKEISIFDRFLVPIHSFALNLRLCGKISFIFPEVNELA